MGKKAKPKEKKLTNKQKLFVDYLFICRLNAKQAAIRAGYSERSATEIAYETLRIPHVAAAIQRRLSEVHMSSDEALAILASHARGDAGDLLNDYGGVDLPKARELGLTHLIKKVTSKTVTINGKNEDKEIHTETIELHDPQSAIRDILRVQGKIKDNLTINVNLTDD